MKYDLSGKWPVSGGDRAVSSVVGVVLVVAVTVLLAATVAVFAFDVSEPVSEPAPQVAFGMSTETVTFFEGGRGRTATVAVLTYRNGKPLDTDDLRVRVNGQRAWNVTGLKGSRGQTVDPLPGGTTLEVGSSFRVVLWENRYDGYPVGSDDLEIIRSGGCGFVFYDVDASDDCAMAKDGLSRGDTIQVVYESPDSGATTVISSHTV